MLSFDNIKMQAIEFYVRCMRSYFTHKIAWKYESVYIVSPVLESVCPNSFLIPLTAKDIVLLQINIYTGGE